MELYQLLSFHFLLKSLGEHILQLKQEYSSEFRENLWQTTLFWCDFSSNYGKLSFWFFGQRMNFGFKNDATIGTAFGVQIRRVFPCIMVKQMCTSSFIHGLLRQNDHLCLTSHQILSFVWELWRACCNITLIKSLLIVLYGNF